MELQGSHQASGRRFAIVVSSFNKEITDGLLHGARAVLSEAGVNEHGRHARARAGRVRDSARRALSGARADATMRSSASGV